MDRKSKYRLRIQNCIWTIMDVHATVSDDDETEVILSQFEDLDQNIEDLDMSHVSEGDVLMVEQATNALLVEFQSVFNSGEFGPVYEVQGN
ncbi:MAG: hypothetical protein JRI74_02650 [Deltaproteobacteria bacterium]|jgi:hypothetical protein|nr:hypothetical protein [Deltaproteobacteria bacterium]